jgi:hypothetical protein
MPEVRQNPSIPFKDCQGRGAIRQKDYLERLAFPPPAGRTLFARHDQHFSYTDRTALFLAAKLN